MGGGASKSGKRMPTRPSTVEGRVLLMPLAHSKDHVHLLLDSITEFQTRGDFTDMKLQVTDANSNLSKGCKAYSVHKCIFAACSGYAREKLMERAGNDTANVEQKLPEDADINTIHGPSVNFIVDFPIPINIMDQIVRFIYTANIDIKVKDIPDLLEAAVRLKIPSLRKHCVWGLQNGYILEFFRPILRLSEELDLPEVREFALRRTIEKFDEFSDSYAFLQLTEKELQVLVDNRRGCVSDGILIPEVEMFNAILKWEKHSHPEREEKARYMLRHLHYHRIPKATLSGYVVTHNLVKGDKELMESIDEAIGSDKKKVLQRLRRRTLSQSQDDNMDNSTDTTSSIGAGDGPIFPMQPTLIVCGGRLFDQLSAQVLHLNDKTHSWQEISRIPTVLSHHSAAVIDNSLYIAGGEDTTIAGSRSVANTWRYDPPPKNEWTTLPEMQHSRSYFFLSAYNDYVYAFGGKSGKIVRNFVERYNTASRRWEFVACLKSPRHAHAGCFHKNIFFVSGGIVGKHSTVDMLRMDPTTNHWSNMSPMRCSRSRHAMTPVRDRIYVIGGEDDSLGVSKSSSIAIECYTPEYDQWHSVAVKTPVQSDGEFGCAELDGHIFVVGGCKSQLADHRAEVSCYDPEEDRWETKPKLPRRLRGAACIVLEMAVH